jgi:hypothetical protein
MTPLNDYLNFLNEDKKSSSTMRVSRQSKLNREIGKLSVRKAKQKDDPLYRKMMYYKELYLGLKAQLMKKYSSGVRSQAYK